MFCKKLKLVIIGYVCMVCVCVWGVYISINIYVHLICIKAFMHLISIKT